MQLVLSLSCILILFVSLAVYCPTSKLSNAVSTSINQASVPFHAIVSSKCLTGNRFQSGLLEEKNKCVSLKEGGLGILDPKQLDCQGYIFYFEFIVEIN